MKCWSEWSTAICYIHWFLCECFVCYHGISSLQFGCSHNYTVSQSYTYVFVSFLSILPYSLVLRLSVFCQDVNVTAFVFLVFFSEGGWLVLQTGEHCISSTLKMFHQSIFSSYIPSFLFIIILHVSLLNKSRSLFSLPIRSSSLYPFLNLIILLCGLCCCFSNILRPLLELS